MRNKYISVLLLAALLHFTGFAQVKTVNNIDSVQLDESKDLQEQLIPLDSIIVIAVNKSPGIKFQRDLITASKYQVEFASKLWTNNLSGFVNYSAGNQSLVTADNISAGTHDISNVTNGYRAGIQLNLPLYEFVGRKSRINMYKAELQSSLDKEDQVKQEIVQFLIQEYYSLIYYRNLITIRSDAKQAGINQYQVAEQEFKDGIIPASELSRFKSVEVNARADYEEAKRQFSTHYFQFENLVGVPMKQLMRRK